MSDPFAASLKRLRREPSQGAPEPPGWLSEPARELWEEILPKLAATRELTPLDAYPIGRYCTLLARYQECEEKIAEHGYAFPITRKVEDPETGAVKVEVLRLVDYPYAKQAVLLEAQLSKAEAALGIGVAKP